MIRFLQGDITKVSCDAIVNAANSTLLGGGGVDGCIHKAAGPELTQACALLQGCPTGHAKITKAYQLSDRCRYIIHTVGPDCRKITHLHPLQYIQERKYYDDLLASAYRSVFELAKTYQLKHIALPSISTGIYAFPVNDAAEIAIWEGLKFTKEYPDVALTWVLFDDETFNAYTEAYDAIVSGGDLC